MSERPLHVQVAIALGCDPKPEYPGSSDWDCKCRERTQGRPHSTHYIHEECCHDGEGLGCDHAALARYDTDWSATGPLIERYGINLRADADGWSAETSRHPFVGDGATPLLAVCHLLLALHAAGKLPEVK